MLEETECHKVLLSVILSLKCADGGVKNKSLDGIKCTRVWEQGPRMSEQKPSCEDMPTNTIRGIIVIKASVKLKAQ